MHDINERIAMSSKESRDRHPYLNKIVDELIMADGDIKKIAAIKLKARLDKESEILKSMGGLDWHGLDLDDASFYRALCAGEIRLFDDEAGGIYDLTRKIYPVCFEDLKSILALFREDTLKNGLADCFIKQKKYPDSYLCDARLLPILERTHGILLYYEQLEQALVVLGLLEELDARKFRKLLKNPGGENEAKNILVNQLRNNMWSKADRNMLISILIEAGATAMSESHVEAYAMLEFSLGWLELHQRGINKK